MKNEFVGGFNKQKKHQDAEYLKSECGWGGSYKEKVYKKMAKRIKKVIGEKERYAPEDVFRFFREEYSAFLTDITQYYNYCSMPTIFNLYKKSTVEEDLDIDALADELGSHYAYIRRKDVEKSDIEQSVMIVIDIVGNSLLRKKHSRIKKKEKEKINNLKKQNEVSIHKAKNGIFIQENNEIISVGGIRENILIVMGSIDGKKVNSMKILLGSGVFPELEYALEFFRRYT